MFYFVEPSEENFSQYEKWVSSARQSEVFFGDMVKQCYKCSVKPGQTLFIPTGIKPSAHEHDEFISSTTFNRVVV